MTRVPLLSGSRIVFVPVEDDYEIVLPPRPPDRVVDAGAAVRDALRFPISGLPLVELAPRGGRATIVVEPPSLPLPGAQRDPRQDALAAAVDELERAGIPAERQTILVAGGLGRRLGRHDLERLLSPTRARSFRGEVLVHDAESPDLVELGPDQVARVHPALLDADVVVTVTAAETVVHGGPGALASAADAATARRLAGAPSLLLLARSREWELATSIESALAAHVPLVGISLVLDHPRLTGRFRGYPHDTRVFDHLLHSPFRRLYSRLPTSLRRGVLRDLRREVATSAAYAGPPSVAHAEALLRGVELRGAKLAEPADALVLGVPWIGLNVPREPLNPITAAAVSLGYALRLWRDAFPLRPGGTVVLVHRLLRTFAHGPGDPYRPLFEALAGGRDRAELAEREARSARDEGLLAGYREGRTCHPLRPFADWASCATTLGRVGEVVVAGSRDAAAARALGFVPARSVASALEMAHGLAGGRARVGVLPVPPYAPILVGETDTS